MKRIRLIAAILLVFVCALVLFSNCTHNGYHSKVMQKKHKKYNSYQYR